MSPSRQLLQRLLALVALGVGLSALAQEPATPVPAHEVARPSTVSLHHRRIVELRATVLGDVPSERAELAREALDQALAQRGAGRVTRTQVGEAVRFELDGTTLFYLVPEDLSGPRPGLMLDAAAQEVEVRLNIALREAQEMRDPRQLAIGASYGLAATVLLVLLLHGLVIVQRRAGAWLRLELARWRHASGYAQHMDSGVRLGVSALRGGIVLLLVDLWATFVLRQFAYTRPWGERSTAWLLETLEQFALAAVGAVPGLLTAVLILAIARLLTRANTLYMQRVERGELKVAWLDIDTAGPTRRLGNLVLWLFALAMAYPYLPGAGTEAFKGMTVLAGLMLSLGASGVVGQMMTGLSLMYSRSLRAGEYVKIGDTEGTVTLLGLFTTKIHTGLGEEVSLPNSVVFSQPVRNFSRLVKDGQFMLQATVTIGYSTPWRLVRAMLLEAARRTPGVAREPEPYVVQTALSDFYVEYRLCAQGDRSAPRRRADAIDQLNANIQDVFSENGVQIMSPHYRSDPAEPQVVPPGPWFPTRRPIEPPAGATSSE
jgi:small-conductance mechanosensitive channel